ncbi:ABC transporter ATP-binding protein [Bacillus coahuilensis]|uniref:ABC transporter ATP-binding protein n=1 Tax=Bacillus coahuilensis TaxID=408580 RepID=UPI0001850705|nr:ABC transporter ATP-binding protein [Bacillus coahuilensis]
MTSFVSIEQATKTFQDNRIFHSIHISLDQGEILSLVGPSGTGKSTLLRCISGLEEFTSGAFYLEGKDVTAVSPNKREVGLVFQKAILFPQMTVLENVMYGLRLRTSKKEAENLAKEFLYNVRLHEYEHYYPNELSGGQQQRVALIRALVLQPKLLLLDEPFSSLDEEIRMEMREWVRSLLKKNGTTSIFVTHDKQEAMLMGDRVGVLHEGELQQIGKPLEVYESPATPFVASFFSESVSLSDQGYIHLKDLLYAVPGEKEAVEVGDVKILGSTIRSGEEMVHLHLLDKDIRYSVPATKLLGSESAEAIIAYAPVEKVKRFK